MSDDEIRIKILEEENRILESYNLDINKVWWKLHNENKELKKQVRRLRTTLMIIAAAAVLTILTLIN